MFALSISAWQVEKRSRDRVNDSPVASITVRTQLRVYKSESGKFSSRSCDSAMDDQTRIV